MLIMRLTGGLLALFGALVLVIGLFLGFGKISQDGASCGSAFRPNSDPAIVSDLTNTMIGLGSTTAVDDCKSAVDSRKPLAYAGVVPGVVLLLAGLGVWVSAPKPGERYKADSIRRRPASNG